MARRTWTQVALSAVLAFALANGVGTSAMEARAAENDDTWEALFGGTEEDLAANWTWRAPRPRKSKSGKIIQPGKWHVLDDGVLECLPRAGYIWTKEKFDDFVMDFEFKVSPKCNSGLFFRTNPRNAVQGGMEIQILDSHGKKKAGKHDLGALYDCQAPSKNMAKPPGQWQHMVLTANDNIIMVVLNGATIIDLDLNHWSEPRKNPDGSKSKFRTAYKDMPRTGHIGFQDHGHKVWFRNIKIKRLNP